MNLLGAAPLPAGSAEDCGDGAAESLMTRPIDTSSTPLRPLADSERRLLASQKAQVFTRTHVLPDDLPLALAD